MTIGDADHGDVVRIGSIHYRLMIQQRGGFLCRYRDEPDDDWSTDHVWMLGIEPIDEIVTVNPKRNPKARKAKGRDLQDPMQWKGTTK